MKKRLSTYQGSPMRVEKFSKGEFHKLVLPSIVCIVYIQLADVGMESTYVKAQTLAHFSCILSEGKCMHLNT